MSETAFYAAPNSDAIDYALRVARFHVEMLQRRGVRLDGAEILELGPGADFCAALVLASHGAKVTLADRFLTPWRDDFHPGFYRAFLDRYDGRKSAVEAVVAQGGYDGVLRRCRSRPRRWRTSPMPASTSCYPTPCWSM